MTREIYKVYAEIVDANGTQNPLKDYPKNFDSKTYNNDTEKARQRAYGEWHDALGAMYKRDDRQLQVAYIVRLSDGLQIEKGAIGAIADLPDPEPVPAEPAETAGE